MSNKSKTRVEKYPLPSTVDGICSLIREILSPGLVQRIELDIDAPVRVVRGIPEGSGKELEEDDIDLDGTLRNIEIIEYTSQDASPFQVVFDMMQLVNNEKLNSVCWVSGPGGVELLGKWLELNSSRGMPGSASKIVGLPVHQLKSLSEDTLILCASQYPSAGFDELSLAIKTAIEIRRPNYVDPGTTPSGPADDSVRSDPGISSSPTHQLAAPTGGLRKVAWKPTNQP